MTLRYLPGSARGRAAVGIAAVACAGGLLLNQVPVAAVVPAPASVFVYDNLNAGDEGFTDFGTAAGRTVVKSATFPTDLNQYACIVLPVPRTAYTTAEKTAFGGYVSGGGTLLALGDNAGYNAGANANINTLSTALGAGLTIVTSGITGTSTNIKVDPITNGVAKYEYLSGSTITVASPGKALIDAVGVEPQPTVFAAALHGRGVYAVSGDSNAFSDFNSGAYTVADNGKLVANLCAIRGTATTVACPGATVTATGNCTVTVRDIRTGGHKTAPGGKVTVTTTGSGTFGNGGTCTLAPTAKPGEASCVVPFTPATGTPQTVAATYNGDVRHAGSAGRVNAAVAPAPIPTPTATPTLPKAGHGGPSGESEPQTLILVGALLALPFLVRGITRRAAGD